MSDRDKVYPHGYCRSCLKVKDRCTCTEDSIKKALKESLHIPFKEFRQRNTKD